MLCQLFILAQVLLVSATPVNLNALERVNPIPGLTIKEMEAYVSKLSSTSENIMKKVATIEGKLLPLGQKKSFATSKEAEKAVKESRAALLSEKKELKGHLAKLEASYKASRHFRAGARNHDEGKLTKIGEIKAEFQAHNIENPTMVETKNPLFRYQGKNFIVGLTPSEAKWNQQMVGKKYGDAYQLLSDLQREHESITVAMRTNDLTPTFMSPEFERDLAGVTSIPLRFKKASDRLQVLNDEIGQQKTLLGSLRKDIIEAEGFVNGAYQPTKKEIALMDDIRNQRLPVPVELSPPVANSASGSSVASDGAVAESVSSAGSSNSIGILGRISSAKTV